MRNVNLQYTYGDNAHQREETVFGLFTLRASRIWGSAKISNTNKTRVFQSRIVHRVIFVVLIYIIYLQRPSPQGPP